MSDAPPPTRLAAIDRMRGFVMVLMAIDHASDAFNRGRLFTDSAFFYKAGTPLPEGQFLTRWITHLCAPTFLFLAGTGLAFQVKNLRSKGASAWDVDRHLLVRGLVIAGFELWIGWFIMPPGKYLLQVLYAIGASYLFMIPLRRLPAAAVLALGAGLAIGGEVLVGLTVGKSFSTTPLPIALLFTGGQWPSLIVGYPAVHWLAMMLLGWAFGLHLLARPMPPGRIARLLAALGAAALVAFAAVRAANAYGNMLLYREGGSLVQWLHVSKYPPSLAYTLLELGLMCLCLAGFFALSVRRAPGRNDLFLVLGQTPMFFYLLHFPILVESAHALGVAHTLGLRATYAAAAAVVLVLYPACRWYRGYKTAHPKSIVRYV